MKPSPLKRTKPWPSFAQKLEHKKLAKKGKRGKRLEAGDKKVTASVKGVPCEMCGAEPTDPHHIITRGDTTIRHEPLNIVALCREHHDHAHDNPLAFREWLESRWPGRYETLETLSEDRSKTCKRRTA